MKKLFCLFGLVLFTTSIASAQDEGNIVKRDRIQRDNGIFIGFGPSFTLGKNIGDYSTGFNFETGYLKRVNRILSIGPSISYLSFKYDPAKTSAEDADDLYVGVADEINTWHERFDSQGLPPDYEWDYGFLLNLEGGDISLISLAVNLKLNLIPIKDNTKVSVYAFAKPFVAIANRKEVTGTGERYVYEWYEDENDGSLNYTDDGLWYPDGYVDDWGPDIYPALKEETTVTGGIFLGPGVEFIPTKAVSLFAQVSFGYTFPISMVSTKSYDFTIEDYLKDEFPMVKEGFPSVNIQFGASFNF